MPGDKPKDDISEDEFKEIASKLRHFAKRYDDLAGLMRERKLPTINVGNMKSLKDALILVYKAVNRAYEGFDAALLNSGVFSNDSGVTLSPPPVHPSSPDLSRPLSPNEQAATEETAKVVNIATGMKMEGKPQKKAKGKK